MASHNDLRPSASQAPGGADHRDDRAAHRVRLTRGERIRVAIGVAIIALLVLAAALPSCTSSVFTGALRIIPGISIDLHGPAASKPTTLADLIDTTNSYGTEDVTDLFVTWRGGSVRFVPTEGGEVVVHEEVAAGRYEMDPTRASVTVNGGTLRISDGLPESDNGLRYPDMRLTIEVPVREGWRLRNVTVQSTAAELDLGGLSCASLGVSTVSSSVSASGLTADRVEVDSVSGDVTLTGSVADRLRASAVSADQSLTFSGAVPSSADIDSVSGDVTLRLPDGAGATVSVDSVSGDVASDRSAREQGEGTYAYGDGAAQVTVETVSGDVHIRS